MKKTITAVIAAAILFAGVGTANAQTLSVEAQYRQALMTLIQLLIQKVEMLQKQLETLQKTQIQQNANQNIAPVAPVTSDSAPSRPVTPVTLQARAQRTINPNKPLFQDIWQVGKSITVRNGQSWLQDRLEILVNVGGQSDLNCAKFGNWTGPIESKDQWVQVENPTAGEYRVRCTNAQGESSEDYTLVQTTQ